MKIIQILFYSLLIILASCKKQSLPEGITTSDITNITSITAQCYGYVENDGGQVITERGFCWGKNEFPSIEDNKKSVNDGKGSFSTTIEDLDINTTYYVRSYAINKSGIIYGNLKKFNTSSTPSYPVSIVNSNGSAVSITSVNLTSTIVGYTGLTATIKRGFCWSTSSQPQISDNQYIDNVQGMGTFSHTLENLTPNTKYYVRAFALIGTKSYLYYGDIFTFQTPSLTAIHFNNNVNYGNVTDNEGTIYKTTVIGSQTWMAENLKVTHFNNGDLIPTTALATSSVLNSTSSLYQWAYNLNEEMVPVYGRYYTWYAVNDSRGVCPQNWHVPTKSDWELLISTLGGFDNLMSSLAETGNYHWNNLSGSLNNNTGFTALPSGLRYGNNFSSLGTDADWWSSTVSTSSSLNAFNLWIKNSNKTLSEDPKSCGLSIRCIKD